MKLSKYEKSHRVQDLRKKYHDSLSVDDIGRIEQLKKRRAVFSNLTRQEQMEYLRNSFIERIMKDYEYPTKDHIPSAIMDRVNTFINRERTTVITFGEKREEWLPDPLRKFDDYSEMIHELFDSNKITEDEYNLFWVIGSFFHGIIHKASPEELLIEANELGVTPKDLWEEAHNLIVAGLGHIDIGYLAKEMEQHHGNERERR